MPQVSVIIPTFNRASMVGAAIQSVLEQTFVDWELIVVDDGSQDSTREVVAAYTDSRVRYVCQENHKLPGARNTGIRASTGMYLAFLDSDDLFLPEKLALQVAALERDSTLGLVASGWKDIDLQHRPRRTLCPWKLGRGLVLADWLHRCPFIVPAVLVRRDWLLKVGLFDEQQHYVEDWDLWLRLSYAGCRMAWEPGIVCLRTLHEGNMVHDAARMSAGLQRVFDKFFAQPNLPESIRRQMAPVYANVHLDAAVRFLGAGMVSDGERHLQAAVELNPALLNGEPPAIIQSLASSALAHLVPDAAPYVADVAQSLKEALPRLAYSPRRLWAAIRATEAFDDLANGRRQRARLKAAHALMTDPGWLRNRGLLGILLKP
jgi:hypothetical protein